MTTLTGVQMPQMRALSLHSKLRWTDVRVVLCILQKQKGVALQLFRSPMTDMWRFTGIPLLRHWQPAFHFPLLDLGGLPPKPRPLAARGDPLLPDLCIDPLVPALIRLGIVRYLSQRQGPSFLPGALMVMGRIVALPRTVLSRPRSDSVSQLIHVNQPSSS